MELFGNKPVDVSVYYEAQNKLGTFVIMISRKRVHYYTKGSNCAAKIDRLDCNFISDGPFSAAPVAEDEKVFMEIDLYKAKKRASNNDTALLKDALQK